MVGMMRTVALIADCPYAEGAIAQTIEMLDRFGVRHSSVVESRDWRGTLAQLEAAGAAVYIVYNIGEPSLAGTISGMTEKPVLAVPLEGAGLSALEALQQATAPGEAPVGSLAIGKAGAINAALLAVAILAGADAQLAQRLGEFRSQQTQSVLNDSLP